MMPKEIKKKKERKKERFRTIMWKKERKKERR